MRSESVPDGQEEPRTHAVVRDDFGRPFLIADRLGRKRPLDTRTQADRDRIRDEGLIASIPRDAEIPVLRVAAVIGLGAHRRDDERRPEEKAARATLLEVVAV